MKGGGSKEVPAWCQPVRNISSKRPRRYLQRQPLRLENSQIWLFCDGAVESNAARAGLSQSQHP
jgi:hypothetical protein